MTRVVVNGNFEGALKRFSRGVARSGVPSECRKREHFQKPGVERRAAKKEAMRNASKKSRRDY
jgi:small subunit ribosomal protein S21